jgi:tRNA-splicing ligase RtcB
MTSSLLDMAAPQSGRGRSSLDADQRRQARHLARQAGAVGAVVDAADRAGLARKVARLAPLVCIKG